MKIKLTRYNAKGNLVMLLLILVFSFAINCTIFGNQFFSNWKIFLFATLISTTAGYTNFALCGLVTVSLKNHFPDEKQLFKRLALMISTFLFISGLYLYFLFKGYEQILFFNYTFDENSFVWSYLSVGILTIFLTFLMEGIAKYKDLQANRKETEKLNETYKKSQLNGLKSQVNPHFLFNSLNSLSSLIQDNEEKAEKFLDEMSKVYRYMLRNDDEQLVTLEIELKFVESYTYLLKERYGDGLQVKCCITPEDRLKLLPPLTLQIIIENTFSQNIIDKSNPLIIEIITGENNSIQIKNNIRPKTITNAMDFDTGLDNLIKKYELLNQSAVVSDTGSFRLICLPLISKTEEALV